MRSTSSPRPVTGSGRRSLPARPGEDYRFVLDGADAWPDPCSRWQPEGVRGPSRILDTSRFEIADGPGLRLEELVVYELHVGTFSPEGTFAGVVPRLAALRELGVTAIELMPVATFPGDRGWGYDGLYTSAPHQAYGGPDGSGAARRRRPPRGARRDPRRRLQPPGAGERGADRLRARTSPTASARRRGARRSTTRARGCASGRSRMPSSG